MLTPLHKELVEQLDSAHSTYLRTVLGMGLLGVFVGSNTYYLGATGPAGSLGGGWVAAALTMAICLAMGVVLGVRRAGATGLSREPGAPPLGEAAMGVVLERLGTEKEVLPIAQAEARVAEAVAAMKELPGPPEVAAARKEDEWTGTDKRLLRSMRRQLFLMAGQVAVAGLREEATAGQVAVAGLREEAAAGQVAVGRAREAVLSRAGDRVELEAQRLAGRVTVAGVVLAMVVSTVAAVVINRL